MLKQQLLEKAHQLGFASCRITTARPVPHERLLSWLGQGRHGAMRWMERDATARCDPVSLLPGAQSVICCALPFGDQGLLRRKSRKHDRGRSKIARFARGADYHEVVREKLEQLAGELSALVPGARTKCCVDTSPLMEKALAVRAGIGWMGKHTLLINPRYGSWFVLGEVITNVGLAPDVAIENRCNDCQQCIRSCPTGALDGHWLDARKCISYLTIEHRGPLDEKFQPLIECGSYGCDRCQEACPYNRSL